MNIMNTILYFILCLALVSCGRGFQEDTAGLRPIHDSAITQNFSDTALQKDYYMLGLELMNNEKLGGLFIGLGQEELNCMLGEPDIKTEEELWDGDGAYHHTLKYTKLGVEIDITGDKESGMAVNMITAESPCSYKLSKGISIGSSLKEVEQAYREYINPIFSNSESVLAGSLYGGLIFYFKDDKVNSIFIGATAE